MLSATKRRADPTPSAMALSKSSKGLTVRPDQVLDRR